MKLDERIPLSASRSACAVIISGQRGGGDGGGGCGTGGAGGTLVDWRDWASEAAVAHQHAEGSAEGDRSEGRGERGQHVGDDGGAAEGRDALHAVAHPGR